LGMPQKPIDKLTFEDFLMVKERLVAQEVPLQELNNRAAGKVPIKKRNETNRQIDIQTGKRQPRKKQTDKIQKEKRQTEKRKTRYRQTEKRHTRKETKIE